MRNAIRGWIGSPAEPNPDQQDDLCVRGPWGWIGLSRHSLTPRASRLISLARSGEGLRCAFYGELFDRASLAQECSPGPQVEDSNAELILALFRVRGQKLWASLNGSFVFALVDDAQGTAFLVNDRFASIPLFYSQASGTLVFASDFSEAERLSPCRLHLDENSAFSFLTYQRVFGAATLFEEVRALTPASCLTFSPHTLSITTYFQAHYRAQKRSPEEWADGLAQAWEHSVRQRTEDSPVVLLSGGLDSRAVLAARPGLPSVVFADYENHEVMTARRVAALTGSNLDLFARTPTHYADLLDEGVAIGGGMFSAHMAHVPGFYEALAQRAPAVIHGNPPEAYFRNSSLFPGHLTSLPSRDETSLVERLMGLFRVHAKYGLAREAPWDVLTDSARHRYPGHEAHIHPLLEEATGCCESMQDMYTWVDTRYMSRYPSYIFELAIAATLPKRTPMWDNALYDLHLEMPWKIRDGDTLWLSMMQRLNPRLARVASANRRVVKMNRLPVVAQRAIISAVQMARRLHLLPSALPSDPTYTLGSWPNFDELIRRRDPIRRRFREALSDPEGLPSTLFDSQRVMNRFEQHLAGKRNDASFLFTLVTFSLWHKQTLLGTSSGDNRPTRRNEL